MSLFQEVPLAPEDPIMGIQQAFVADARDNKVNLGVGAYKTSDLKPLVLTSVREAEAQILEQGPNKEYLPISGDPEFLKLTAGLALGDRLAAEVDARGCGFQTVGATGALRLVGEFYARFVGDTIYLTDPTWANHRNIFSLAGLKLESVPYYDRARHCLDFDGFCKGLQGIPEGSAILLHGCCHNPSGMDPSIDQWVEISRIVMERNLFPIFDFAYQGFGRGLEEDAQGVRYFVEQGHEMAISYCYSKNLGLYGERVGALFFLTSSAEATERAESQIRNLARGSYSNPPLQGSRIAKAVLSSPDLRKNWEIQLADMRQRLLEMRKCLASELTTKGSSRDFSYLNEQNGMFSFLGLERDQVEQLRHDYGIYMPASGRISVAGISGDNLDYVVEAILSVL